MFPTVYRRACQPKSSVFFTREFEGVVQEKNGLVQKFFGAICAGGPLLLPTLGPCPALDGPAWNMIKDFMFSPFDKGGLWGY